MRRRLAAIAGVLALPAWAGGDGLEIALTAVRHAEGQVRVGLYADPATFRKEARALATRAVPAAAGEVRVRFDGLAPGRYAVMAYHDEDANGELNRRFGMFPTEGYGLSNNPTVTGPPGFDECAFDLPAGGRELTIELRY